jgi:Holliday junction resolvase RusA-like endonuclease
MIVLPWPDSRLSSNARVHRMTQARLTASHRNAAGWAAKAVPAPPLPDEGDIPLRVTFEPPSRRIDRQNMPHLVKSYIDGIASAWGINDKRFLPEYVYGEPVRGGRVTIEVQP